ncbi:hypothetical protein Pfo_028869 [Paulownia fortunei]|nr:hypothetical protein Pfo_028869 [Paulownia fortunei]
MKLATKSINLHPTISTFFSMLESSNGLGKSPCSRIVDSINWEMDINVLLEKQIEEISNSTDISEKKISKNFVFGLEGDNQQSISLNQLCANTHVTIPLLNNLKGSTESENKHPMETILETAPASIPSIQEEFTGGRLPLNPLAARAALASLRSKFPESAEPSVQSNVEKGDIPVSMALPNYSMGANTSNFESIVKTLFPTSPQIVEFSNVSSRAQVNEMEKKNKISEKKITQPSETRFTRAQIQRNNEMHESTQITDTIGPQNCLSDNQKLVASPIDEETEKNNVQPKLKSRKSNFTESNELDLSKGNVSTESNRVKTTPKTAESGVGSSQGIRRKSASSKKQETRFSHRLRFLPRTRSQNKA